MEAVGRVLKEGKSKKSELEEVIYVFFTVLMGAGFVCLNSHGSHVIQIF